MESNTNTINFKNILIDEVKYIYPQGTKPPEYVIEKLNKLANEANKNSNLDTKTKIQNNRKLILDILFDNPNYKPKTFKFPLVKKEIGNLLNELEGTCNDNEFMWKYYMYFYIGFYFSTLRPASFGPNNLSIPKEFVDKKKIIVKKLKDAQADPKQDSDKATLVFLKEIHDLAVELTDKLIKENNSLMDLVRSKAKGDVRGMQEILLGIGISINSFGEVTDVIDNSLSEGLTQTQFFNNSSQGIQSLYAKSVETAKPGYLGRRMLTVSENVKLSKTKDCFTKNCMKMEIKNKDYLEALTGRNYKLKKTDTSYKRITNKDKALIGKIVYVRSPLFCKAEDGICSKCYDEELIKNLNFKPGSNIGINASGNLLGNLVNLTLKGSHTGVSLDQEEIDFEKDMLEYM